MLEFSHHALESLEGHGLLAKDVVHLPDIRSCFFRWESYHTLDPVKPEPYQILSAVKVPVAVCQLIGRYWFLAAIVPCDCGWGE